MFTFKNFFCTDASNWSKWFDCGVSDVVHCNNFYAVEIMIIPGYRLVILKAIKVYNMKLRVYKLGGSVEEAEQHEGAGDGNQRHPLYYHSAASCSYFHLVTDWK